MQLFEEGHNRRNWAREIGVPLNPSYSAIKLDLNPQTHTFDNGVALDRAHDEKGRGGRMSVEVKGIADTTTTRDTLTTDNTENAFSAVSSALKANTTTTTTTTNTHRNGGNRLSDLVKSAKRHSETLRARNERVAESKRETRRRYGW